MLKIDNALRRAHMMVTVAVLFGIHLYRSIKEPYRIDLEEYDPTI